MLPITFNGIDGANINNARCSSQLQPLDSCACLEEPPMGARKASSQAARRASLTWQQCGKEPCAMHMHKMSRNDLWVLREAQHGSCCARH